MASTPISRIRAKIYSHKSKFTPREAAAIMLNIDTEAWVDNEDDKNIGLLAEILKNLAFSGIFKEIEIGQEAYFNEVEEFIASIAAIELKQWALDNGYNWLEENNLLKEEIVLSVSEEIKTCENIIKSTATGNEALKAEITRLKAEIAELKAQSAENGGNISTVDYNSFSIYGHTTPAIKAIFETIHRFWRHHDLSQPDTITNAKDIIGWIREQYPENEIGKVMAESIQKITRPPEARLIGSKGNNKKE